MKVQIELHASERAFERGTNENEIIETLRTGRSLPAKNERLSKEMVFYYAKVWKGKYFQERK